MFSLVLSCDLTKSQNFLGLVLATLDISYSCFFLAALHALYTYKLYTDEGKRQLSDERFYKKVDKCLTKQHMETVNDFIDKMCENDDINETVKLPQKCGLLYTKTVPTSKNPQEQTPPLGRPVLWANGCLTKKYQNSWTYC